MATEPSGPPDELLLGYELIEPDPSPAAKVIAIGDRQRREVRLSPAAERAYREAGWKITEHGHADTGQVVGPCARCAGPTVRYGPAGQPLCRACRDNQEHVANV